MVQTWTERTHEALKGKIGKLIGWSFAMAILVELWLMIDPTYYGIQHSSTILMTISVIGLILYVMSLPMYIGYNWVILDTVRNKELHFQNVFKPFRKGYRLNLATFLLTVLFQLLWGLLLIVPGIIKYFSYAFTFFILRDEPHLSPIEAITKSRGMMRGQKWEAFKLILPMIPVFLTGLTLSIVFKLPILSSWSLLVATSLVRPLVVARFAVMYEDSRRAYDEQWNKPA
ncbi:DUF975 family protein [Exiguobacterium sp. s160]|uniref:DUF975 family protein n=1 Tax=Exiguobacterium sp. s160 TaxID=2751265 RepID=UPI001BE7FBC0|nr:DUF975 family protein [Exiguobacterium sp. s160]